MSRPIGLLAALLTAGMLLSNVASAQEYPSRLITIIVNVGPGGITDLVARLFADHLAKKGHQAVVLNRAGAGGNLGLAEVARAKPDGYTIGSSSAGSVVINPYLFDSMSFDPFKDLVPIAPLGENTQTLVVNGKIPVSTVREFVDYVKANPGRVNYASPGTGSTPHLVTDQFARAAGIEMVHVPYKSGADALTAVLGGSVQMTMVGSAIAAPHVATGAVKILAVASPKRLRQLPNLPTITESGIPGVQMTTWYGLFAPAGTSEAIVRQLNTWAQEMLTDPAAQARLDANSVDPLYESPAEFAKRISSESKIWKEMVTRAGLARN